MASREELLFSLREALKARTFDAKLCVARAKALRRAGIGAIAAVDLSRWMRGLEALSPASPGPSERTKLLAALDRINWDGGGIAIRERAARRERAAAQTR